MSTPPRRLKDDPDFLWETGCDLADEAFAVGGYDLPDLKARVLSGTQPPSAGAPLKSARSGAVAVKAAGVFALLGLGGLAIGWWAAPESLPEVAPPRIEQPAPIAAPAEVEVDVGALVPPASDIQDIQNVEPAAPAAAATPAVRPSAPPSQATTARPAVAGEADVPVEDLGGAAAEELPEALAEGTGSAGPASTLAAEVALYDEASERLASGDATGAAQGYRHYLDRFPEGRLVVESRLGLLRSLVGQGASAGVDTLALELLADPRLAGKRGELLRMRADNLVLMGRCDDALEVARELPSREAAPIRRACRWKP